MFDIIATGDLLIDFTENGKTPLDFPIIKANPGGASPNLICTCAKFGLKTSFIGKVGDDAFGSSLANLLRQRNVDTANLIFDKRYFTTLAFVTLDESGDRDFSFARKPGADTQLEYREIRKESIDTRIFHFGSLMLTQEPSRSTAFEMIGEARRKGALISFDPNLRESLWEDPDTARKYMIAGIREADIVKISEEEVRFLFGCDERAGAEILLSEMGVRLCFVTLGKKGCYYKTKKDEGAVGTFSVKTIDTTGAGDIFGGSALYKLLSSGKRPEELAAGELKEIAVFANTAASLSTAKRGGIPSIPELREVEEALASLR